MYFNRTHGFPATSSGGCSSSLHDWIPETSVRALPFDIEHTPYPASIESTSFPSSGKMLSAQTEHGHARGGEHMRDT